MCEAGSADYRADSIALAVELARAKPLFDGPRQQFHEFLSRESRHSWSAIGSVLLDKDLEDNRPD